MLYMSFSNFVFKSEFFKTFAIGKKSRNILFFLNSKAHPLPFVKREDVLFLLWLHSTRHKGNKLCTCHRMIGVKKAVVPQCNRFNFHQALSLT